MRAIGSVVPMASLHDAYEFGGVAGHGRTTLVRLAVRRGDCRPVALKQLRMEHAFDPDKRARFIRQYRRASMLEHDNIETLLDITEGDDGPVAVAEWIDGRSLLRLTQWRRELGEAWDPSEITTIANSLLEALRYAHNHPTGFDAQGMLHGGVWPGNVLLDTEGHVTLVDFGMSAVWQEGQEPWQDLEALRYLSAEHTRHGPTPSSDLYGVGAIVHELLDGPRFREDCETESEMRATIDRTEPPPKPSGECPPQLEQLRRRLLEPVPNPRLTLEHMLDLCAAIPSKGGRDRLSALVRRSLRTDNASPDLADPEPTPDEDDDGPDGMAQIRARPPATAHLIAGRLKQLPLGQGKPPLRAGDAQSVPVPIEREETAARHPMFLKQTDPPKGEEVRSAELRRSGIEPDGHGPKLLPNDDTAPLPLGRPAELDEASSDAIAIDEGIPIGVPRRISDVIDDPDITAEVTKVPQLPEDVMREEAAAKAAAATASSGRGWLGGPLGWALLGAIVVGIGLPLLARCGS